MGKANSILRDLADQQPARKAGRRVARIAGMHRPSKDYHHLDGGGRNDGMPTDIGTESLADAAFADAATEALAALDPTLEGVIGRTGPLRLRLERNRFRMIVRAILSQQISMAAARTIRLRFERLVRPHAVTAERVRGLSEKDVRAAGLTGQKTRYVLKAAEDVATGTVPLSGLGRMSDAEAIAHLTQLVGVGRWTAEMVLMFSLGRPDVFPVGDLGVRNAIRDLYGIEDEAACETLAETWRPYRSVATWYLWRHADQADVTQGLESYPV